MHKKIVAITYENGTTRVSVFSSVVSASNYFENNELCGAILDTLEIAGKTFTDIYVYEKGKFVERY